MQKGTAHEWLEYLDQLNPHPDGWRDPEFVYAVSWLMLNFIPRRMGQRLAEAADVPLVSGTDLRDEQIQREPGESPDPIMRWH